MKAVQLTKKTFQAMAFAIFCLVTNSAMANNIAVSNYSLVGQNRLSAFTMVKFDLSWENSWRTATGPSNWDAAWVFVKFRVGATDPTFTGVSSSGTTVTVSSTANLRVGMPVSVTSGTGAFAAGTVVSSISNATQFVVSATPSTPLSSASIECKRIWEHANLNNTGHTAASGSTIDAGLLSPGSAFNATTNPAVGVFIYRASNGAGTNTFNNTQLRWNYGANGVGDGIDVGIAIYAIEMVYVPGGVDFNVGGDGTNEFGFTSTTINIATATTAPSGTGSMGGQAGGYPTDQTAPDNATWPNGYNAFYCMKYETSQGQYRDFLNTLTYTQQVNRTATAPNSASGTGALHNTNFNRNGLDIQTSGNATTLVPAVYGCNLDADGNFNETEDGEWIACNFMLWMDGCAFIDWAGLRPMTELEYEKACRGNQTPVANEYAWGNTSATSANNITNPGQASEVSNTANANSVSGNQTNVPGPMRVGVFAGATTTRAEAGATYYGIMEMSGNLLEQTVGISNPTGRVYTGTHGDGNISTNGHANSTTWPGLNSGEVTSTIGAVGRGGGYSQINTRMQVSDRALQGGVAAVRNNIHGIRCVRSAP